MTEYLIISTTCSLPSKVVKADSLCHALEVAGGVRPGEGWVIQEGRRRATAKKGDLWLQASVFVDTIVTTKPDASSNLTFYIAKNRPLTQTPGIQIPYQTASQRRTK